MTVQVIAGDIAQIPADAIITAINSSGMWFGGIDGVLKRAAGNHFHDQADALMPLSDGQTILASGNGTSQFQNVIFVVDDVRQPLSGIVFNGLLAASNAGFKSVTLPAIRTGVMLGCFEKTKQAAVFAIGEGVRRFLESGGDLNITFVVYSDRETQDLLSSTFLQLPAFG
jgi:O-acetyl-ADP-ribose deacetylase (regulator of RNase III)